MHDNTFGGISMSTGMAIRTSPKDGVDSLYI